MTSFSDEISSSKFNGCDYIFPNFSALTTGFALAMASLPIDLKSNEHPWISGYRWVPQNVVPHLHLNPVNPTFFLQAEHLFGCAEIGWTATVTAAVTTSGSSSAAVDSCSTSIDEVDGIGSCEGGKRESIGFCCPPFM